ncbi:MAG: MFS transporter [Nannocystaceae bacterium]|nr:MFS transporter [Nannocystaceae bacterium]
MNPPRPTDATAPRSTLALGYVAGALQGLAVVTLPASASVVHGQLGLDDARYGALFLAQTATAIAGALAAGAIARAARARVPLSALLAFALAAHAVALASLVAATVVAPLPACLLAAAALGLGFGVGAVPLNALPAAVAPSRRPAATVAMHAMVGSGFAIGPAIVGLALAHDRWSLAPLVLAVVTLAVAAAVLRTRMPTPPSPPATATTAHARRLGTLGAIAVAYALAEGTLSNWITLFLHDGRGVDGPLAALALSGFWAALAGGRLLASVVLRRTSAFSLWQALLSLMALVLAALPAVQGPASGIVAFIVAGLATSAVFPLTVALAGERLGLRSETAASVSTAALMTGVGVGSFVIGALREALGFDTLYRLGALYPLLALVLGRVGFARREPPSQR